MSMNQNMNQFKLSPMKGDIAAIVNPNTISVMIDGASLTLNASNSNYLLAGDFVALSNATGDAIQVDIAAKNSTMFGVAIYTPRKDKWAPYDVLEIAQTGSVVYLEATNAIARGSKVEYLPATHTVQTLSSTNTTTVTPVGVALDKASANSQLIRVQLL